MKHASPPERVSDIVSRDSTNRRVVVRESTIMDADSAVACLRACHVGRLIRTRHDTPTIDVIGYVLHGECIYFYAPGESLLALTNVGVDAMLEVDRVEDRNGTGWSVVVKGTVSGMRLPVPSEVFHSLHKRDSAPDHIDDLVRMSINSVVGRRYV